MKQTKEPRLMYQIRFFHGIILEIVQRLWTAVFEIELNEYIEYSWQPYLPHTSPVLHLNLVFTIKIFTFTAQSLNGIKYFIFGSRAVSFKWPLLSVDVSVCVPATLMLNNSETKQFKGFTSNTNPIGMCLRRVDWLRHRWRHARRHNPTKILFYAARCKPIAEVTINFGRTAKCFSSKVETVLLNWTKHELSTV